MYTINRHGSFVLVRITKGRKENLFSASTNLLHSKRSSLESTLSFKLSLLTVGDLVAVLNGGGARGVTGVVVGVLVLELQGR